MVHILDAGAGQMPGDCVKHLVRADINGDFLSMAVQVTTNVSAMESSVDEIQNRMR